MAYKVPYPPSDSDSATRKQRILDVAVDEFSRKGFAAARMDLIAEMAQVNKQLIYYYFTSKLGLYEAVLDLLVETYRPVWQEMEGATVEQMIELREKHADIAKPWRRLLAWEGVEYWDSENRTIHMEELRTKAYRAQTDVIANAQQEGNFPSGIEPQYASLLMLYSSLGPVALPQITKMVTGLDPSDPKLQAGITRALLALMRGFSTQATTRPEDEEPGV
jgi:TetR/AcrR family transcriptional regulator